jgi:hypothetical protein
MNLEHRLRNFITRGPTGQSLVEFALIIPVLLAVFFAIIDGAFLVQGYLAVNHAAREAARFATVYQPDQGECYDYDGDGNPNNDDWPWCTTDANESEAAYHDRRVAMIKQIAVDAASGLRMNDVYADNVLNYTCRSCDPAEDPGCDDTNYLGDDNEPGVLAVCVEGFPDFESAEEENHPGLRGLPVRVSVLHNVPLVVFAPLTSNASVKVSGITEMINEGIQVGYGNQPPPAFSPPGGSGSPGETGDPDDPDDPDDPVPAQFSLNPSAADVELPGETVQPLEATVRNASGDPLRGIRVAFTTDAGSFSQSEPVNQTYKTTSSDGKAVVQINSSTPVTATVLAWADSDEDMELDGSEFSDSSVIKWFTEGIYDVQLDFVEATNLLPGEREHAITADVTLQGNPVGGAFVTFKTTNQDPGEEYAGGFDYGGSGSENRMTVVRSNDLGKAVTSIYANRPITATIEAWLDYNKNNVIDGEEPYDTATKIWEVSGPYLTISDHEPFPQEVVALGVRDHHTATETTTILLCSNDGLGASTVITDALAIPSDTGDVDMNFELPLTAVGEYRVESHIGAVDEAACGDQATRITYSASLVIADVPPDLVITEVLTPALKTIQPGSPITLRIKISNTVPVSVTTGPFGVDIYVDPEGQPVQGRIGQTKQWIATLGPRESTVITDFVTVYTAENHELWFQVDTMNYVDEGQTGGEDNNVFGPILIPFLDCIPFEDRNDDFEAGLGSQWTASDIGNPQPGSNQVVGGHLEVTANGNDIWSNDDSFRYIYQDPIAEDFRMTLQVLDVSEFTHRWAKAGLMVRESTADDSRHFSAFQTHDEGATRQYRPSTGDSSHSNTTGGLGAPRYVRIERADNVYSAFHSADGENWTALGDSKTMDFGDQVLVGIATTSHESDKTGTADYDNFEICEPMTYTDVTPPNQLAHIPGSVQCEELLSVPGFEGNPETVFEYWNPGRAGSYDRGATAFYRGSFSMRLHASRSFVPCSDENSNLQPYLYQEITIPTEVYSISTLAVTGHYLVRGSDLPCSFPTPLDDGDQADKRDSLDIVVQETDGSEIHRETFLNSAEAISNTWYTEAITLPDSVDLSEYAGDKVVVKWDGFNDGDFYGTFFYLDDLSAQACTSWPIPAPEDGMGTIAGRVTTRGSGGRTIPVPGADVRAYRRGAITDAYETRTLTDGSFHFYNVVPGEYIVYAESLWGGEGIRYATVTVDMDPPSRMDVDDLTLPLE